MASSTSQSPARSVEVGAVVAVALEAVVVRRPLEVLPSLIRDRCLPLRVSLFSWSMENQSRRQHHRLRAECPQCLAVGVNR